ncbi:MAG TPA: TonB-dependent receptor [Rhizomicrobium sp.]|jgi:outer membrane receptor protein involved in Fe transport
MKRILLAGVCAQILLTVGALGAPAAAQDQKGGIETVTVTAQKRTESAQNVPIALTVLTSDDLKRQGITKVNGLQYATPSLEAVPAFGSGQPEFRLRGVGFDDYASNNSSTVGVYVDEVAYPIPAQTQGTIFDIQRTEVLYGPQGTLYGVNTTGGAINFITNKPQDEFGAGLTADYDSHNEFIGNGYITGPIADGLDGRLAFITDQGGSWQKNRDTGQSYGKKNTTSVRGELQWTLNDQWNVLFEGHYSDDRSHPTGLYLFDPIPAGSYFGVATTIPAFSNTKDTAWGGSSTFQTLTGIAPTQAPFHKTNAEGANVQIHGDLGFAELTSITSYEDLHRREYNDWDATALALAGTYFDTTAHVFSQELRLASNGEGPFQWMIGGYYAHQAMNERFDSDFADSLGLATDTRYAQHVETKAIFTQEEYQITDQIKLIGGLRYDNDKRSLGDFVLNGIFLPGAPVFPLTPSVGQSISDSRLSGKGELEYKPSDNVMLYASVSEGIKSGGFTTYNGSQAAPPLKPEVLWAYEGGVKSNLLDDTLQLNGSVFWYHYENQQIQSAVWGNTGPVGSLVNAPKSHVYGGELSAIWQPLDALRITQSVGWKDGKFDEFDNFLDIAATEAKCPVASDCVPPVGTAVYDNKKGARIGFPPLSYNGSINYTWQLSGYTLDTGADWVFHDHLNPLLLGQTFYVKSYWLADVNITLSPNDGPWAATVYCHNCTDTKYDTTRNFFLPGLNIAQRGEPATVGVRLDYKY